MISKKKLVITKDGKSGEVLQCRYELLTEKSIRLEVLNSKKYKNIKAVSYLSSVALTADFDLLPKPR